MQPLGSESCLKMASCWVLWMMLIVVVNAEDCRLTVPLDLGRSLHNQRTSPTVPLNPRILVESLSLDISPRISNFCVGEHTGTHLDAPFHFNNFGWTVDKIPLNRLIANGVFLNVTEQAAGNASFRLQPSHIDAWVERHGPFPDNAVLLVSFGWAQRFANRTLYLGTASKDYLDFQFPAMTPETARKLADNDQIVGVGVDTGSVDEPASSQVHVILAAKNIYNLEQVNLDQPCLPAKGFKVYSMPMKISQGTGAPTRITVIPG